MIRKQLFTEDGILIDGKNWTEEDWADLHKAITEVREKIAARHQARNDAKPFDGNTPLFSTTAARRSPPPPGVNSG